MARLTTHTGTSRGLDYEMRLAKGFCAAGRDDEADDGAGNDTEAAAIDLATAPGTLQACESDLDYFSVTATNNGPLTVDVYFASGLGELSGVVYTAAQMEAGGTAFGAYDAMTQKKSATIAAAVTGTEYFIKVVNTAGLNNIAYALVAGGLAVCEEEDAEPNNTRETATAIEGGTSEVGFLCGNSNTDFLSFTVDNAGANTVVRVAHDAGATLTLVLTDAAGAAVTSTATVDDNTNVLTFTSVAGTTYALQVTNSMDTAVGYQVTVLPPPPANDACANAATLANNASVSGNTVSAAADVALEGIACTGYSTPGNDMFYSVTIPAGQTLTATLKSAEDLSLYLVDSCAALCCWGGADDGAGGSTIEDVEEVLAYQNVTSASQTLVLAVDSYSTSNAGAFVLEISVQ